METNSDDSSDSLSILQVRTQRDDVSVFPEEFIPTSDSALELRYSLSKIPDTDFKKIVTSVFKHLDIPTIKELRLVNERWNYEACAELKERTVVNLEQKTEEQIEEFAFILQSLHQRERPSPFQKYNLRVKMTHDQFLDVVLNDPETFIVRLDYAFERNLKNDSSFPNSMYELLQRSQHTLQYLRLSMQVHGNPRQWNNRTQYFPLYLPHLLDFEYWNQSPGTTTIPLSFLLFPYQILLGATNLRRFYSSTADSKLLNNIFDKKLLDKVQELHLTDFPNTSLNSLSKTMLPELKSLGIQRFMSVANQPGLSFDLLKDLIRNVATNIEEIALSGVDNISDKILPPNGCPKLHSFLLDDWFGNLNIFNPDKLPNLKTIVVSNFHGSVPVQYKIPSKPHSGVESFTFKGHLDFGNKILEPEIKTEYSRMFLYIRKQFPNVTSFQLKMAELTTELVRAVIETLPRLEDLQLSSSVGTAAGFLVNVVLGVSENALRQAIQHKTELKTTGRLPCLLDLTAMRTLTIRLYDRRDCIPVSVIRHGIAKLPNLNRFSVNYNLQIGRDIKVIHELLSHISEIAIYYNGREYWYGKNWTELKQNAADIAAQDLPFPNIIIVSDQDDEYALSYRDKFNTVNYQFTSFVPKDRVLSKHASRATHKSK